MSRACSSQHDSSPPRGASGVRSGTADRARARAVRRRLALLIAAATLGALGGWGAAAASADEASTIIERCTHGQSLTGFSRQAYSKALRELPTDVSEYSDCEELIRKAALAVGGGGGPGGGVLPPTPAEQAVLTSAAHRHVPPIRVGGSSEEPGVVPVSLASALNSLPAPLMALLAALLASAAALGVSSVRRLPHVPSLPFRLPRGK